MNQGLSPTHNNQGTSSEANVPLPTLRVDRSGVLRHGRSLVPTQNGTCERTQNIFFFELSTVNPLYLESHIFGNPGIYGSIIPRLARDAWSIVIRLRQTTIEYAPPLVLDAPTVYGDEAANHGQCWYFHCLLPQGEHAYWSPYHY